jgi:Fic family protein
MAVTKTWNWQQADWPDFQYKSSTLKALEDDFLRRSGRLFGAYLHVTEEEKLTLAIDLLSDEALKTSEIEGEILNRESVQSSIRKQLGLATDRRSVKPAEAGIAEMMVDLYRNFQHPLSHEMLFGWHSMIMNGRRDVECIGAYRKHSDPMQVVSGRIDTPTIHFEAPPSSRVPKEMKRFIDWFNKTAPEGKTPLPALTRTGIAHLYFESIHPFEDGNGRIGRAIAEKVVAQSTGKPAMVALSQTIYTHRKRYYEMLEASSKKIRIEGWLDYFAKTILEAQENCQKLVEFIIRKAKFYDHFRAHLNERQEKVITRMFREGIAGFKGGLSAENYIAISGTSRATATRDLQNLVGNHAFAKTGTGKGTRYQLKLSLEPENHATA